MTLIGIAGPKRSGKDTLADGLAVALGLPRDSFAGPMRRFVADTLGMTLTELEARKEQPVEWLDGVTPRQMMQTVGTEWGRDTVHSDLWVRSMFARMPHGGIVSDVRFPNEALAILKRGGEVIRLHREGTGCGDGHASEVSLPDCLVTFNLHNNSTPEAMVKTALLLLGVLPAHALSDDAE